MANEYLSLQQFPGDGVTTDFTVNFAGGTGDNQQGTSPYINITDVKAYEVVPLDGLIPSQRIPRTIVPLGPLTFRVSPAVPAGRFLEITRETEDHFTLVDFKSLQAVSEFDLDLSNRQLLYVTQESSDRASLAFTGSEEAVLTAAEALNVASDALDQVGVATDEAGQALSRANTAINTANSATNTANNASDTANGAVVTANAANSTAGTALTTANSAVTTANAASSTANAASTASGQATNTANSALTTANTALTRAGTAIDTADNALSVANDALDEAGAASTAAGNATDTANNAEQVALGIAGTAGEALTTANTAYNMAADAIEAVGEAGVAAFNGRSGIVLPEAGDYGADMVSYADGTVADGLSDLADELEDLDSRVTGNKTKLDGIQAGAQVNTVTSVAGRTGAVVLSSADVGLNNVTNTSDANKPVSTAQQAALNLKLDVTANAVSATRLANARTINGVSFNGTANITVADNTKLPLTGGTLTDHLVIRNGSEQMHFTLGGSDYFFLGNNNDVGLYSPTKTTFICNAEGATVGGNLHATGTITENSDQRLKKDVTVIPDALYKVSQLRGVTFTRKDSGDRQTGLIAQEVQAVLPEAVVTRKNEDSTLAVAYGNLVGLLVEAIKELQDEVQELKRGIHTP